MLSIFYHTQKSFSESIFSFLKKGKYHAELFYTQIMRKGSLERFSVEPHAMFLIKEIQSLVDITMPKVKIKKEEAGVIKFLMQLENGLEVESVFIPMRSRNTLCISSQVGCKRGCAFCETGRMGLLRNLDVKEIVEQVFFARHQMQLPIENIVFMGMGEPFDNFDAVMRAIDVFTDPKGLGFGPSRITVSTSGLADKIDEMAKRADVAVNLAVSINAPTEEMRRKLMPITLQWSLAQLKEAMQRFCVHPRRQIFIEYVLLAGVNDSLACADLLAEYLQGLKVKVNLIPYNSQSRDRFAAPEKKVLEAFSARMREKGFLTLIRQSKGQNIMAACGQLGNLQLRAKRSKMSQDVKGRESNG